MKISKLTVNGIFNMSFGKTFLTGIIENHPEFIEKSKWKVIINGIDKGIIEIEGEQIVKKTTKETNEFRSISTTRTIDLKDKVDLDKDKVELVKIK